MRKHLWILLSTALVAMLAVGCAKEADLSSLNDKVKDLDSRVTKLEQAVKDLNDVTIPGIKTAIFALEKNLTVVSVSTNDAGNTVLTFSDGSTVVVKDGINGETPVVGIAKQGDVYVWTINGEVAKDAAGNPYPVVGPKGDTGETGATGPRGYTPQFKIEDGAWWVSYNYVDEQNQGDWIKLDLISNTGTTVEVDADSNPDCVILTINGTEVSIPKEKPFALKFNYHGQLNSVGINPGEDILIEYEVVGAAADDDITLDAICVTPGVSAKFISAGSVVSGYLKISVEGDDPTAEVSGKIFAYADNNKGKTNIKSITLEKGTVTAVADVDAQVSAEGGEIALSIAYNKEYDCVVDDAASAWLSVVETKATSTDKLTIVAAANTTGAYRVGVVSVLDAISGKVFKEFTVVQKPATDAVIVLSSISELPDGAEVSAKGLVVLAASKQGVVLTNGEGDAVYAALAGNVAVERGDVVTIKGVKKTNAESKVAYVEVSEIVDDVYEGQIPDLDWYYLGYGENFDIINSGVSGVLQKDEKGYYIATPTIPHTYIDPVLSGTLSSYEGKYIVVKGYTHDVFVDLDEDWNFCGYYNIVANSIEEVTFAVNPNWTLSYEGSVSEVYQGKTYYMEEIKNTVAEGSDDYYAKYGIKVYSAEELSAAGSIENLVKIQANATSDEIQYFFSYYEETIAQNAAKATGSFYPDSPEGYGDFIVFAIGLDEGGYATGKYAYVQFTKESPYKVSSYADFIGKWSVDGKVWTISEKVSGESYTVTCDALNLTGVALDGAFVDGSFAFMEKDLGAIANGYDDVTVSGDAYKSGDHYGYKVNYTEPKPIFYVTALKAGGYEITPGTFVSGTTEYTFNYMNVLGFVGGEFNKELAYESIPSTFETYVPPVSANYEDFIGQWAVSGGAWTVSEKEKGKTYNITGIAGVETNGENNPMVVQGVYTEEGTMAFYTQKVSGTYTYSGSEAYDLFSCLYNSGYLIGAEGTLIATATVKNGVMDVEPAMVNGYKVQAMAFYRRTNKWNRFASVNLPLEGVEPVQAASPAYTKWIGTWTIGTGTYYIKEDIANKSYVMGNFYQGGSFVADATVDFDEATGNIIFGFKSTGKTVTSGGASYTLYQSGVTNTNYISLGDEDGKIATFKIASDGQSAEIEPVKYTDEGDETYAVKMGLLGYNSSEGWTNFGFIFDVPVAMGKSTTSSTTAVQSNKPLKAVKVEGKKIAVKDAIVTNVAPKDDAKIKTVPVIKIRPKNVSR